MSLIHWNIRGFNANREQVQILFREYDVVAVCLQEIKIGDISPNVGLNFLMYRSPPLIGVRAQGGAAVIVKKSVNQHEIKLDTILQACAVRISTNK